MIKNLLLLFSLFSPFVLTKRTDDLGIHKHKVGIDDIISDVGLFKRRRSGSEPEDTLLHTEVETNKRSKKYRQRGNKSKNETPTSTTLLPTVTSTLTSSITPSATSTQTV